MDKKHRKLIDDNIEELLDITNKPEDIYLKLEERRVLNKYMVKFLNRYNERKRQLEEFYQMIKGRGPLAFDHLLSVLRETENFRAEQLLSYHKVSTYESPLTIDRQLDSLNIADVPDGLDRNLKVKVHPDFKFMDNDEENLPGGTYKMRSKPRGHALIINIYVTRGNEARFGSEVDVKKLETLFKDLGYKVIPCTNLTLKQMQDQIKSFSMDPELSAVDSIVVFIMSHGKQHSPTDRSVDLITSDGLVINTNWITERFTSKYSKLVSKLEERKPKLFFFQACRISPSCSLKLNIRWSEESTTEADSVLVSPAKQLTNRNFEDTFQIFSTITGYPSMRDKVKGAWFVDKFCKIVAENAWKYDLDTMLGMVDEEVRKMNSEKYGYQTCEVLKQGVSKKLFFNPGLYEESK